MILEGVRKRVPTFDSAFFSLTQCVCACVCACVRVCACAFQHPSVPICTEQLPTGCSWGLNASLTHNLPPPPPPPPIHIFTFPPPPISPACSPSISLCHYFILLPVPALSFVSTFVYFKVTIRTLSRSTARLPSCQNPRGPHAALAWRGSICTRWVFLISHVIWRCKHLFFHVKWSPFELGEEKKKYLNLEWVKQTHLY